MKRRDFIGLLFGAAVAPFVKPLLAGGIIPANAGLAVLPRETVIPTAIAKQIQDAAVGQAVPVVYGRSRLESNLHMIIWYMDLADGGGRVYLVE